MSKNKYVIIHGQIHAVSDDELMHWKYIKREKVNGKWVYTYDNDKLGIKNFIDTKITGKAYKQHAQEVTEEKRKIDNQSFDTKQSRINAEQTSKGYSGTDPKVIRLKEQEKSLSEKSKDLDTEKNEAMNNYENHSVVGNTKRTIDSIKSGIKTGIDTIKDKLGVDEREKYLETKKSHEYVTSNLAESTNNENSSVYDYDADRMAPDTKKYWSARAINTGKEYMAARNEYLNTPLGKLDKAAADVKDWINDLFDNKRNKR